MNKNMKLRINLKKLGLALLGVVLVCLLYCFASNGRYERVEDGSVVFLDGTVRYGSGYGDDYVYLDTWRGRLCYFGTDGKKRYIKEDD